MAQWKMVGVDEMLLGYTKAYNLNTAISSSGTTTVVLASGGADFAAASASNPIEILIDIEAMFVTARSGNSLTVTRGALGTAAASSHSTGTGNVHAILDLQMPFTRQFTINPQTTEITFQGDGDQEYVSLHLGMRGQITADKWLTTVWENIFGVTAEVSNLPPDEVTRWMPETGNYPALRLRCILHAIDDSTGLDVPVRLEVPKAQIYPRPWQPMSAQTAAKQEFDLQWTAQRTKLDLVGVSLPGTLPTRGVFYTIAQLSTSLP